MLWNVTGWRIPTTLSTMKIIRFSVFALSIASLSSLIACGGGSSNSGGGGGGGGGNTPTGFSKSSLKGNYTFLALGSDVFGSNTPDAYQVGGVLVADGNGNITGGEQTYSNAIAVYPDTFTGTYTVSSDGTTTLTLNTSDAMVGVNGVETFSAVLLSASQAIITQFDASATSNGTLDLQATPIAAPTGGYAFSSLGIDFGSSGLAIGGVFNIDNNPSAGSISGTGSVADVADFGTLSLAQSVSGSVSAADSFGRVNIDLVIGPGPIGVDFDGYIVDSTHIRLVETDTFGITGGTAIGQGSSTGSFSANSAFSGPFVFGYLGFNAAGPGADAGVFTADGAGNLTNGLIDQNQGGFVISDTVSGTYAVDNTGTGRVVATTAFGSHGPGPSLIFYLAGSGNPVPMLQTNTSTLGGGTAYAQASGAPSFNGTYGVGFTSYNSMFDENDGNAQLTANASAGTFSGMGNINEGFTPTPNQTFGGTFTSAGGRFTGTITIQSGTPISDALYFVDSTQAFVIETDATQVTLGIIRQQVVP
jgi:hypothetical protein